MELRDVLYIIDGSVEVTKLEETTPAGGPIYEAVLYDNTHDPCQVDGLKPEPGSDWRNGQARAKAVGTPRAALATLTRLIAGRSLGHDWPVMWKSCTEWLRVPPTLALGDIEGSVPKAPRPEPESEADTETAVAPV